MVSVYGAYPQESRRNICVLLTLSPSFSPSFCPCFGVRLNDRTNELFRARGEPNSRYHVYQVLGCALTSVRPHLWLFGVGPDNSVLREVDFF